MKLPVMVPDWPAPPRVRAISTLRRGGVSQGPYASLNLGAHVGDRPGHVAANRRRLSDELGVPPGIQWLEQVHGTRTVAANPGPTPAADATHTATPGLVCAVMTADCLPILLCARDGSAVAAIHAGWRGLAAGIVASCVSALPATPLLAWFGPAIGPDAFAVGPEVCETFALRDPETETAFRPLDGQTFLADIYALGRLALERAGLAPQDIHGGGHCTYRHPADFFSYRRDRTTGRMATLIWLE